MAEDALATRVHLDKRQAEFERAVSQIDRLITNLVAAIVTEHEATQRCDVALRAQLAGARAAIDAYRGSRQRKVDEHAATLFELGAEKAACQRAESLIAEIGAQFAAWHLKAKGRPNGGKSAVLSDEDDITPWLMRILIHLGTAGDPKHADRGQPR